MTEVERLARFVVSRSSDDLSEAARAELKIRVLDALGILTYRGSHEDEEA